MTSPGAVVVAVGAELAGAGLSPGSTGNLSVRDGDRIVCTPTGSRLGRLAPDTLSTLDLSGRSLAASRPTKEVPMHLAVYAADAGVGAVVHLHPTSATALSCLLDLDDESPIRPLTPYLTMQAGRIGLMPYATPGSSQIAGHVSRLVGAGARAVLMRNHGILVTGQDLWAAAALAAEMEEASRIDLLTRGLEVVPIPRAELDRLHPRGS